MTQRIALVSGGTRGIGGAISLALKAAGYNVAANYAARDDVAKEFSVTHGIPVFKWNIAHFEECQQGVAKVEKQLGGPVEILVNNAGITRDAAMHKMTAENWDVVVQTNLSSSFYMSRAVIESMRSRNFGRIINISSMNGQLGQFGQTNYSAAKSGLFGFTKSLARETSAKGITVNAIAPGYIETDMTKNISPDIMKQVIAGIPVGRMGHPDEIARAVVFLAADDAGFITGETISINGGQHME
ncbi:MAG: acetoacetyl-CoA reductase [Alphaproteobacteria bacterium]|nr:acetoacetyl-CoA reductase [Alphaproteobacteria bacterium]